MIIQSIEKLCNQTFRIFKIKVKPIKTMKNKLFCIFLVATSSFSYSQKIETAIDSTKILIGSQFHLTLKTKIDTTSRVYFPEEKHFGALEVLESYPIDTIKDKKNKSKIELFKKYGLTQFDSGRYVIPQLKVLIDSKPFLTDSLQIEIVSVEVDTLKQPLFDIKDIIESKQKASSNWLLWLLVGLAIVGIGFLGFRFWQKHKKSATKENQIKYTPIEKATIGLQKLEEKQLLEKGEIKDYYSELTDIARTYLEEAVKFPAMENTTSELIDNLKKTAIRRKLAFSDEIITALEKVLRQSDLVKFAKSKPLDFEIVEDRNTVEKTIRTMHGIIPLKTPEEEEAERNEELRLLFERKQKRKKLIANVSFFTGIFVVIGLAYWLATGGFLTLKSNILGHSTAELLREEWTTSEYGNPPIKIETPKVLKRMELSKVLSEESKSLFKDVAVFTAGEVFGNYYFEVTTMKFQEGKQEEINQIGFELILEQNYTSWEKQGARNILMQHEQYKTPQGIEGVKAYGTMNFINPVTKSSTKTYYEMLVFKQSGGMQQIITMINESDPNKNEIIDKIINSVELGQVK